MYERKDRLYRKAKAQGLRSRAAFKLEDLDRGLLGRGHRVIDLGCWPGGWLQVASRRVGPGGRVVGIDTRAMAPLGLPNVRVLQGDVCRDDVIEDAVHELGGLADVVLSDMSPSLTGIRDRDEAQASELVRRALGVAERSLRPGGSFVCKIFMNGEYRELRDAVARRFEHVSTTRSEATRKGSAELYLVARGLVPAVDRISPE
ncbi:MAG: RlmE family RNA methyltransferase [Candidatus Binatia bacterium]